MAAEDFHPHNHFTNALLTDMYQISMAYASFRGGFHMTNAVFDLFFRTSPFKGQFAVFAGLEEVLRFVSKWSFSKGDIDYIRSILPNAEEKFFEWLSEIDCSSIKIYALQEGTICFPRVPLLRVEGPIAICQLLETPLLVLINYATLVATNAARHRLAAGEGKKLLEFGLRRAQGPDGAVSATHYCYMGGFDGTSNVLAGKLFGITPTGTMAHSFVTAYHSDDVLPDKSRMIVPKGTDSPAIDLLEIALSYRLKICPSSNLGEIKAFVSFASSYPEKTLCLVDTYNTLVSGVPNFLCVALALHKAGYRAVGIRLDSGDLAYLSRETRTQFAEAGKQFEVDYFEKMTIVASNDLNEHTILSLNQQGHQIDVFAVGTHLVTCKSQPALGGVYKLVQFGDSPRIKLSEEFEKVTIPCRKEAYRLYVRDNPVVDLLVRTGTPVPKEGQKILCQHPFIERKRAYVSPTKVVPLHQLYWEGKVVQKLPSLTEIRTFVTEQLKCTREDHLRPLNPTPFKVSVDFDLFTFLRKMWLEESPISELK